MAIDETPKSAINIFVSYAHEDEHLRALLMRQLSIFQRQGLIQMWYDRNISAGTDWSQEVNKHLETAHVILLLVSPSFIISDYCYSIEMNQAMKRHEMNIARIIPIILRPVSWHEAPFGKLQALPKDGKAITSWKNKDEAFFDVAKGIRKVIDELRGKFS